MEAQLTQRGLPAMGLPGLAVSTGITDGVPCGVQLVAGRYQENILFAAAAEIEVRGAEIAIAEPVGA
jgi:amidase